MPEGHSVHRLARQFGDVFAGERLAVSSPQGRFAPGRRAAGRPHPRQSVTAHGKHLFLEFEHGLLLHVHLGLYGAWDFGGDASFRGASSIGAPRKVGEREVYDDGGGGDAASPACIRRARRRRWAPSASGWPARTAGPISAARPRARRSRKRRRRPYWRGSARTRCGTFRATGTPSPPRVAGKRTPLAALLMDQKVIAGVGNVYRAELLFRQRLNPWLPGAELSPDAARRLWDDTVAMMSDGVRDGRIITTPPQLLERGRSRRIPRRPAGPGGVPLRLPAARAGLPGLRNAGGADRTRRPEAVLVPAPASRPEPAL